MKNLYFETIDSIRKSGHETIDIAWVGSADGRHRVDWNAFAAMAAQTEYDAGFGGQEIARDLVVVFFDGQWLSRGDYDGSEWWTAHQTPMPHGEALSFGTVHLHSWRTLADGPLEEEEWSL